MRRGKYQGAGEMTPPHLLPCGLPAFWKWKQTMNLCSLHRFAYLVVGLVLLGLAACTTEPRLPDHAFEFDAVHDSPDIEVLNYQYGNSKLPGVRPPEWALKKEGYVAGGTGIHGPMPRGDFLYVKWRIKSTGKVLEDTVDFRSRLPADITDHRIHFVIRGSQLYVYLITPEKLTPNPCPSLEERRRLAQIEPPEDRVFRMYCSFKILTIYPNPLKH